MFNKHEAGGSVAWRGAAVDGSSRGRPTLSSAVDFLDGCRKIQVAKHRAITLCDVKDLKWLVQFHLKRMISQW
jgi:hypothetical protein